MPLPSPWVLIVFALLSAHFIGREHGAAAAIPRFYIAGMYAIILLEALGDPAQNGLVYLVINRYGFLLVFLTDIIPPIARQLQRMNKHDAG